MKGIEKRIVAFSMVLILGLSLPGNVYAAESGFESTNPSCKVMNTENTGSSESSVVEKVDDEDAQQDHSDKQPEMTPEISGDDAEPSVSGDAEQPVPGADQTTTEIEGMAQGESSTAEAGDELVISDAEKETNTESHSETLSDTNAVHIEYQEYLPGKGWQETKTDGEQAGLTGESVRLEGLKISLDNDKELSGDIKYRAHVQNIGWQTYQSSGGIIGKPGEALRIEAVQMYLTDELSQNYDIWYSVHVQNYGWMKWVKGSQADSGMAGTSGMNLRVEAIKIQILPKEQAPEDNGGKYSYLTQYDLGRVVYSGHQQNTGNLSDVYDGDTLGVLGKNQRMEQIIIEEGSELQQYSGTIMYRVHIQYDGTSSFVSAGKPAGTTGQSKRIEAVQMYLTLDLAENYDIYYRVHVQNIGWMKWVKGSEAESGWAGTEGLGLRVEGLQVKVVKKGEVIPSDNSKYDFLTDEDMGSIVYAGHQQNVGNLSTVSDGETLGKTGQSLRMENISITLENMQTPITGGVQYRAHVQNDGWKSWVSNGKEGGTHGQSKRMEAVQIKLAGTIELFCDVWYRVHVQNYGWLGWAKNGQTAGTTGINYRIEAIEIRIVPNNQPAPGANSGYYKTTPKMSAVDQRIYNYCQSVYNSVGRNLYSCYNWVVRNMSYQSLGIPALPSGYSSRCQWYAVKGFSEHRGNCYCYAATFYYLAKYLGYNAQYVEGSVTAAAGGYTPHGWVVINGSYICDPEAQDEIGVYNFYMQPIGNTVLSYIR